MRFSLPLLAFVCGCARPNYVASGAALAARAGAARGCGERIGADCISVEWETIRFGGTEYSAFLLKIGRPNLGDGSLVVTDTAEALDVELWMPDMGHGTGPVHVRRVDVGTYRVSHVYLPHGGLWEVRVGRVNGGRVGDRAALRFTL